MSATRTRAKVDDSTPQPPQSTPSVPPGYGMQDHSFTLQAIMELQKSVTEVNVSLQNLKSSVDSTKSKVEDLIGWKNKIIGGAIAVGVVCTLIGFAVSKASDYISIKAPTQIATPAK